MEFLFNFICTHWFYAWLICGFIAVIGFAIWFYIEEPKDFIRIWKVSEIPLIVIGLLGGPLTLFLLLYMLWHKIFRE